MCKGIKDLFLVLYRNLIHHLHPLWVISECFGDKKFAVFLVFAVVKIRVNLGYQIFNDAPNLLCFEPKTLHAPPNRNGIVLPTSYVTRDNPLSHLSCYLF